MSAEYSVIPAFPVIKITRILIIKESLCGFLLFIFFVCEPKTAINESADAVASRRCPTPETGKSQFSPSPAFTVIYPLHQQVRGE